MREIFEYYYFDFFRVQVLCRHFKTFYGYFLKVIIHLFVFPLFTFFQNIWRAVKNQVLLRPETTRKKKLYSKILGDEVNDFLILLEIFKVYFMYTQVNYMYIGCCKLTTFLNTFPAMPGNQKPHFLHTFLIISGVQNHQTHISMPFVV